MTYTLFRLKIVRRMSPGLYFPANEPAPSVLQDVIEQRPHTTLRRAEWHVGNVEFPRSGFVKFRLGKVTKKTQEFFNERTGDFVLHSVNLGLCTQVAVDLESQVCAIQEKPSLAPVGVLARNLGKVLGASFRAVQRVIDFDVPPLRDPELFVQAVRRAERITSFQMSFTPPNPYDADDYERPMQALLEASGGTSGHTTIQGPSLSRELVVRLSKAVAKAGNKAVACLRFSGIPRPQWRSSLGDPLQIREDDPEELQDRMREAYWEIDDGEDTADEGNTE